MILTLFILSLLFVVYVYVGYPLLLWFLTRSKEKKYPKVSYQGDISIVMVVCNEEQHIEDKLKNIENLICNAGNKKVIIVDDASNDNTCALIEDSRLNVHLIKNTHREGKANGINIALAAVQTELVMLIDCRQELELDVMEHLSSWFAEDSKVGAISGELMFKTNKGNDFSSGMDGYWRYEKFIRKSEAILNSVPGVTGALYMLRAKTFKSIPKNTLLDDVQIPMVTCEQGYHIGYDDRALAWDIPSTSVSKEKARKIRTLSGNYQLLFRFPHWILPKSHPIAWQFFSHKIARLLVPFVIMASIVLSLKLYSTGYVIGAVYALLVFSVLALIAISRWLPILGKIKYFKLLQSFILLNWFCVLAFKSYFFTRQAGSWKK